MKKADLFWNKLKKWNLNIYRKPGLGSIHRKGLAVEQRSEFKEESYLLVMRFLISMFSLEYFTNNFRMRRLVRCFPFQFSHCTAFNYLLQKNCLHSNKIQASNKVIFSCCLLTHIPVSSFARQIFFVFRPDEMQNRKQVFRLSIRGNKSDIKIK